MKRSRDWWRWALLLAVVGASALNAFRSDALTLSGWAERFAVQVCFVIGALVILQGIAETATDWLVRTARRLHAARRLRKK